LEIINVGFLGLRGSSAVVFGLNLCFWLLTAPLFPVFENIRKETILYSLKRLRQIK
jgi:hypothetical protein